MVSVAITWRGKCLVPGARTELLLHVRRLAELNDRLLREWPVIPRHPFLELITSQRSQGVKPRANIELLDRQIEGNILVNADLFSHYAEFEEGAASCCVPILDHSGADARESVHALNFGAAASRLIAIEAAHISGINFDIYDPRRLYPGEDRVSFTFLECSDLPFLDNRICEVFHRTETPGLIDFDALPPSAWYVRAPQIHLRHYLESWFDQFLSWTKFFFVPELDWWHHEPLAGYAQIMGELESLQKKLGAAAKDAFSEALMADLLERADNCVREMARLADQSSTVETDAAAGQAGGDQARQKSVDQLAGEEEAIDREMGELSEEDLLKELEGVGEPKKEMMLMEAVSAKQ